MKRDGQNFLSFWTVFLPFYLPNNPKNQNFGKLKKTLGDIIILQMCTINNNQMIVVPEILSVTDRFFCYFGSLFALLPPLTTQNIKTLKKFKKTLEILSFYTRVPKIRIICYTDPKIWRVTDVIIFYFKLFFALLSP